MLRQDRSSQVSLSQDRLSQNKSSKDMSSQDRSGQVHLRMEFDSGVGPTCFHLSGCLLKLLIFVMQKDITSENGGEFCHGSIGAMS